jgi:hypothetical protein
LRRRGRLARERLGEIVDVDENPPAAAAQRINQLVAGDRKQPWREWRVGVPGMSLQMHRQQNVLHDILGLIDRLTSTRQPAARPSPQHRSHGLEQTVIGRTIARNGQPHQAGPLVFTFAHARSHASFRSFFQFVTPPAIDHEFVINIGQGLDRSIGSGIATKDFIPRLITLIAAADTRSDCSRVLSKGPSQPT